MRPDGRRRAMLIPCSRRAHWLAERWERCGARRRGAGAATGSPAATPSAGLAFTPATSLTKSQHTLAKYTRHLVIGNADARA